MSITSHEVLTWKGSSSGTSIGDAKPTYTLGYRVISDSTSDGPQKVMQYFREHVLWFGSTYQYLNDYDAGARVTAIDPTLIDKSGGMWDVAVKFEYPESQTNNGTDAGGNTVDNPTLFHDEIEISHTQISVPVWRATYVSGFLGTTAAITPPGTVLPPQNSACVPFDPPLETLINIRIVRITKNRLAYTSQFDEYLDSVNSDFVVINKPLYRYSDTWWPFTAKIVAHESRFQLYNTFPYWKESVEVHIKDNANHDIDWGDVVLDQGLEARAIEGDPDGSGGTISANDIEEGVPAVRRILDKDGNPISSPVMLDGDGQPLREGGQPVWITYMVPKVRPFSSIDW